MSEHPTYHDLYVTTQEIPRRRLFDLPMNFQLICTRVTGWCLYRTDSRGVSFWTELAGEYAAEDKWLILDVNGTEIVNSRDR